MSPSWKRLELVFWSFLPLAITCALVVFYVAPKHSAGLAHVMPQLYMIPIFYWGLLSLRGMPYLGVFLIGLMVDVLTGLPLGLTALLNLFFLLLVHTQRKYIIKEGFIGQWMYFSVLLLAIMGLNWVLLWLLQGWLFMFSMAALIQWLLTVCCYPIFHHIFDRLQGSVDRRRWRVLHGR